MSTEPSPRDAIASGVVWDPFTYPVDTALIAGIETIGRVQLEGWDDARKWKVTEASGSTGATASYEGHGVAAGKLVWTVWTQEQWLAANSAVALFRSAIAADPPTAVQVIHPDLMLQGITDLVLVKVGKWQWNGAGVRRLELELQEYLPAKDKAAGGVPGGTTTQATTPGGAPAASDGSSAGSPPPEPYTESPALTSAREEYEEQAAEANAP